MDAIVPVLGSPYNWPLFVAALAVFVWYAKTRAAMNVVAGDLKIPERLWTYDASDIEAFAEAAQSRRVGSHPMLSYYVNCILHRSDLAFAVALSSITAWVWLQVAMTPLSSVWLNWLAWPAGAMAILYGVADVAEDFKLAAVLSNPEKIDRAEAAALNMLTRIKITALILSIIGGAIFAAVQVLQMAIARTQKQPAVAGA